MSLISVDGPAVAARVCGLDDLTIGRGAAALVAGRQIAIFRVSAREVLAVQQEDPYSGAYVMSRGIVGTRGGALTVASPMYKQVFDARTGDCLESMGQPPRALEVYPVDVNADDEVFVTVAPGGPL